MTAYSHLLLAPSEGWWDNFEGNNKIVKFCLTTAIANIGGIQVKRLAMDRK